MQNSSDKCTPFWYAVGGIVITPVVAVILQFFVIALIVAWPIVPIMLYLSRRNEYKSNKRLSSDYSGYSGHSGYDYTDKLSGQSGYSGV